MDHLVAILTLLPSPNPLDWFGLTPIESFKEWLWPQPEPEGFHPIYTLKAAARLVVLLAIVVAAAMGVYQFIMWRIRRRRGGSGGRGPGGRGGGDQTWMDGEPYQHRQQGRGKDRRRRKTRR